MRRVFFSTSFLALMAGAAIVMFGSRTTGNQVPSSTTGVAYAAKITEEPIEIPGIDDAVEEEIKTGHIPGAVVLVGHQGRVVYSKAFGTRDLNNANPMKVDTIFDIASLTKVVATTTAIMQLWDRGLIRLDDRVVKYWPEFVTENQEKQNFILEHLPKNKQDLSLQQLLEEKRNITLRQLLTHTSGLREGIDPDEDEWEKIPEPKEWSGYEVGLERIATDLPPHAFGKYKYSCVNFIVLGEVVHKVSGQRLNNYCTEKIFKPLQMKQTSFKPLETLQGPFAPCKDKNGHPIVGEVQDPNAFCLGGVAGNAGVFSTADDLARFAQMLLNGGKSGDNQILSPQAVAAMTKPRTVTDSRSRSYKHGLGWDISSPLSATFKSFPKKFYGHSFPDKSYGHLGYTGTSIWIDPGSQTYLIILTNRLYSNEGDEKTKPYIKSLRTKVAAVVAEALGLP